MLRAFLTGIVVNTGILVAIALWIPMGGLSITPISRNAAPMLLVMGTVFVLLYHTLKPILSFLATPINLLTLGLAGIVLNFLILYAFAFIVNSLQFGVNVSLGSLQQTFILSIILSITTFVIKRVL